MLQTPDVVVIGGGMAGTAAALAGAARGARVTLVRAAPGATALCAGGWRGPLSSPLAQAFAEAGHEWHASTQPLPTPAGEFRRFEAAAAAQAAGVPGTRTLVCGVTGLAGFHAEVLARVWRAETGADLRAVHLVLADTPATGWSIAALAARLDRRSDDVARAVAQHAHVTGATRAVFPAILGFKVDAVRSAIGNVAGVAIGETLAATPSLPGWRLQSALEKMLEHAGVSITAGSVVDRRVNDRRVEAVLVRTRDGATHELTARSFVLATGKFIGGGVRAERTFMEPALRCPVWIDHVGERFERVEPLTLTNANRHDDQPLLAAGVQANAEGKPVNESGAIVFDNVWVAGAVRAGVDGTEYGLGQAAADGWSAGERAAS